MKQICNALDNLFLFAVHVFYFFFYQAKKIVVCYSSHNRTSFYYVRLSFLPFFHSCFFLFFSISFLPPVLNIFSLHLTAILSFLYFPPSVFGCCFFHMSLSTFFIVNLQLLPVLIIHPSILTIFPSSFVIIIPSFFITPSSLLSFFLVFSAH